MTVLARIRDRVGLLQAMPATQLEVLLSSISLIGGKVATMGFGFLAWIVAARMYSATEVGLASGAVSAVTLCAQVALLGVGSAVITLLPGFGGRPAALLDTATSVLTLAGLGTALLFLLFAGTVLEELRIVAADPVYAGMFIALAIAGTLGVLFDQASTASRRGHQVLIRGVAAGVTTLVGVAVVALWFGATSSRAIFFAWVLGGLVTWGLGLVLVGHAFRPYRYRPHLSWPIARELTGAGIPNYALTLAERAPGFALPILVTELLSPADNAHWYAAWMMAWVVFIIPIQVGMTSFAEIARDPHHARPIIDHGIRTSLILGVAGALLMAVVAGPALSLLGHGYAAAGAWPLRVLAVGIVPMTLLQAYFSLCRARRRLGEAIVVGGVSSVASIVAPVVAGLSTGLIGMAVTWLVVQSLAAIVAVVRLRVLTAA